MTKLRMKHHQVMPLEGDYSGRGTWANNIRFCAYRYHSFRGKPTAPFQCLYPARPGHKTCESHKEGV